MQQFLLSNSFKNLTKIQNLLNIEVIVHDSLRCVFLASEELPWGSNPPGDGLASFLIDLRMTWKTLELLKTPKSSVLSQISLFIKILSNFWALLQRNSSDQVVRNAANNSSKLLGYSQLFTPHHRLLWVDFDLTSKMTWKYFNFFTILSLTVHH